MAVGSYQVEAATAGGFRTGGARLLDNSSVSYGDLTNIHGGLNGIYSWFMIARLVSNDSNYGLWYW